MAWMVAFCSTTLASLAVARVAVAGLEDFSSGQGALLHAVVAARRSDDAASAALHALSTEQALQLLMYLSTWVEIYSRVTVPSNRSVAWVPMCKQVASWTSLLLDGLWTTLVFSEQGTSAVVGTARLSCPCP